MFFNILEITNSENVLPRRETIFVALAHAAVNCPDISAQLRSKIYSTLINLCRNDEDLFFFVSYCMKRKKSFSSSLNKRIKEYYNKKDPMILAKDVTSFGGYFGWKHKDLLKLCHCESKNDCKYIYNRILFFILLFYYFWFHFSNNSSLLVYFIWFEEGENRSRKQSRSIGHNRLPNQNGRT